MACLEGSEIVIRFSDEDRMMLRLLTLELERFNDNSDAIATKESEAFIRAQDERIAAETEKRLADLRAAFGPGTNEHGHM